MRIWETAPDIAHAGETGFDRGFGVGDHFERELGDVFVQHAKTPLVVVAGKVEGQVGVRVHESGRKGGVAEIDDLSIVRNGYVAPGGGNGVAFDHDDAVRHERFRFAVEETCGFEGDRPR